VDIVLLSYHLDSPFNSHQIFYTLFNLQKSNTLEVGSEWGTDWWKKDSGSGVKDASVVARREDVMVRICSFDILFINNFQTSLISPHSSLSLTLQDIHELSEGDSGVFAVVSWRDLVQNLVVSRRDGVVSSEV